MRDGVPENEATTTSANDRPVTWAGRHRVLKWAPFVFRIIIFIFGGSTSGLTLIGSRPDDTFEFFEVFEFFSHTV